MYSEEAELFGFEPLQLLELKRLILSSLIIFTDHKGFFLSIHL